MKNAFNIIANMICPSLLVQLVHEEIENRFVFVALYEIGLRLPA